MPSPMWVLNLTGDVFLDWLDSSKWTEEMWKLIGLSHQQAVVKCVQVSHWTYQVLIGNEHRWHWVESNLVRPAGPSFPPGAIRSFCACHFMMVDSQLQVFREHNSPPFHYRDEPGSNISEHSADAESNLLQRDCLHSDIEQALGSGAAGAKWSSQFSPRASSSFKQP